MYHFEAVNVYLMKVFFDKRQPSGEAKRPGGLKTALIQPAIWFEYFYCITFATDKESAKGTETFPSPL
jgi:hypothetical protein